VQDARRAFDMAASVGYTMNLLDLGGGFPGNDRSPVTFKDIASVLNRALDKHFPLESAVRVIAEPGRYYVSSCATLVANVITKRNVKVINDEDPEVRFAISCRLAFCFVTITVRPSRCFCT
jgi:ornithine decarboxylase